MTFAGCVPKGTTNLELTKAFLQRFNENDLKSVQDFGGSNFEVTFRNKVAVDRFLADSATIMVKGADIHFEYRGLRTISVHVYELQCSASSAQPSTGGLRQGAEYLERQPDRSLDYNQKQTCSHGASFSCATHHLCGRARCSVRVRRRRELVLQVQATGS
ncbi:hypothetical protein MRX96_017435 [Rhipicephalus microplus]